MSQAPISPLRRRMIEDMTVRGFELCRILGDEVDQAAW
jgi:hypothetical protein